MNEAAVLRFISAEPLLGPLVPRPGIAAPANWPDFARTDSFVRGGAYSPGLSLEGIDWLICGGESGPKHRPMRVEWARDLRDACLASGTAFFFKQWGGRTPKAGGRELGGRTWDEYPQRAQLAVA